MKKNIFILLGIIFSTGVFAQTTAESAVMTFEEKFFDFGDVKQGQMLRHTFHYKNTGNDTLKISNVVCSSGCMTAQVSVWTVPPGASASITVLFNSDGLVGVKNKTYAVLSNAIPSGADPAEYLRIRVNVIP